MAAPPPSQLSKKPVPDSPSRSLQQITSKSSSNSFCKTLIIVLLLLIIPLFPSQAPDFITHSIFTDFWEIIHLLFIGIAVSYGLFGRKTNSETLPVEKIVLSRNNDDPRAYLSGFSQLSSIFEDGFENLCGPDEQYSYIDGESLQSRNGKFLDGGNSTCVAYGVRKIQSLVSSDGNDESVCGDDWKFSQYSKGESLVVVSDGKHFVDGGSDFNFMPLNLPVRSLRSKVCDDDKPEIKNRPEIRPNVEVSSLRSRACDNGRPGIRNLHEIRRENEVNSRDDVKVVKIRGVVPTNLDREFEEVSRTSPIPWRSRSMRSGNGERMRNRKPPVHCGPHSVGEFEFEQMESKLNRGSKFCSSPELTSSKMDNVEGEKVVSVLHPKTAPVMNHERASSEAKEVWNFEHYMKNHEEEDDNVRKGKQAIESLELDTKSPTLAKVLSRAKSVRTIKPRGCTRDEKDSAQIVQNPEFESIFPKPKPKPTLNDLNHDEKEDLDDGNVSESRESAESDNNSSNNSVEKEDDDDDGDNANDSKNSFESDGELEGSEVDRKAGEFIAKFREQIRLQKISANGSFRF